MLYPTTYIHVGVPEGEGTIFLVSRSHAPAWERIVTAEGSTYKKESISFLMPSFSTIDF